MIPVLMSVKDVHNVCSGLYKQYFCQD